MKAIYNRRYRSLRLKHKLTLRGNATIRMKTMLQKETPSRIKQILNSSKTIAIVGLSPRTIRPSHQVARYLMEAGYTVIPVNPGQKEILGQHCYPNLISIPVQVDIVDIFRKSDRVLPIVEDAVRIKTRTVWMQIGVVNESAAKIAQQAGIQVIMDRCIKTDHMNLIQGRFIM